MPVCSLTMDQYVLTQEICKKKIINQVFVFKSLFSVIFFTMLITELDILFIQDFYIFIFFLNFFL